MKNTKSKSIVTILLAVILTSFLSLTGCSKQDKEVGKSNNDPKTEMSEQNSGEQKYQTDKKSKNDIGQEKMNEESEEGHQEMHEGSEGINKGKHAEIKIPSAQCDICKKNISKALKKVKGVSSFEVDIDNKIVHLNFDDSQTNLNKIEDAITMAGYDTNNKRANPDAYDKLDDCCKKPEDRAGK